MTIIEVVAIVLCVLYTIITQKLFRDNSHLKSQLADKDREIDRYIQLNASLKNDIQKKNHKARKNLRLEVQKIINNLLLTRSQRKLSEITGINQGIISRLSHGKYSTSNDNMNGYKRRLLRIK